MKKTHKALLILGLTSLILAFTGCQEADQASCTDTDNAQKAQTDQAATPKDTAIEAARKRSQKANGSSARAIKTSNVSKVVESESPSLKFDKIIHDFGVVGPNVYVDCEYKFTNTGEGKLIFPRNPKAGCGCTVVKLDKMEYEPSESGTIKVKYHSNANPGNVKKHITVFSNDPDDPSLDLTLTAKIELAIVATPKVFNLSLKKENAGIVPIVITSKDGKEFSIKSFNSTSNIITAEIDKTAKATEFTINPKVDLGKLKSRLNGNITINLDHPNTNQVVLRYTTPPKFKASSSQIFMFNPDPDKPEKRNIMVISNYGEQVEIESIISAKKCMKVLSQKKKGKSVQLVVEVTPKPQAGNIRMFYDSLMITLKGGETLRINATGAYKIKKPHEVSTVKINNVKTSK